MPDQTDERLREIEEREAKATPGPWNYVPGTLKHYVASADPGEDFGFALQELHWRDGREVPAAANAAFIAHARTDIPYLLALNRTIAAELADHQEVLADKRRLTRELDVVLCGEDGAAQQASLVDVIVSAKKRMAELAEVKAELANSNQCGQANLHGIAARLSWQPDEPPSDLSDNAKLCWSLGWSQQDSDIELRTEAEALRADAERYRYIRQSPSIRCSSLYLARSIPDGGGMVLKHGDDLDAAIDTARREPI